MEPELTISSCRSLELLVAVAPLQSLAHAAIRLSLAPPCLSSCQIVGPNVHRQQGHSFCSWPFFPFKHFQVKHQFCPRGGKVPRGPFSSLSRSLLHNDVSSPFWFLLRAVNGHTNLTSSGLVFSSLPSVLSREGQ